MLQHENQNGKHTSVQAVVSARRTTSQRHGHDSCTAQATASAHLTPSVAGSSS